MKNDKTVVTTEHKGFYQPIYEEPEEIEKQKKMLGMETRKTFQEMKRETIKVLIELSPNVEEADKIINERYGFKTIGEKIAFLKGMFDLKVVGHENDEPDEMTYWAMLTTIISLKLYL